MLIPKKILSLVLFLSFSGANAHTLRIRVSDLRSGDGFLAISIFAESQKQSYPEVAEKASKTYYLKLNGKTEINLQTADLTSGKYAVVVMHDEDGDKKMRTSFLGIPREGFGFSNNPAILFGAPNFKRVEFNLVNETETAIKMKYF